MKRESLGWFVAGAVIVLTCTLGAMQQQGSVGRFQLFKGECTFHDGDKGNTEVATVWRIDTVTGDTVMFHWSANDLTTLVGWMTVEDVERIPRSPNPAPAR